MSNDVEHAAAAVEDWPDRWNALNTLLSYKSPLSPENFTPGSEVRVFSDNFSHG
jgi:hypothetical protein